MTISKDRVKPSPRPDSWKLNEIFATGIVIGTYLALVTVLFYWVVIDTTFFEVPNFWFLFLELLQSIFVVVINHLFGADSLPCKVNIQQY